MKLSKKMVVLLIQIFVVALALAMTVSTYAWYTSNTRVEVTLTTVQSAAGANTTIISETNPLFDTYMGQKGTDDEDEATYYVEKQLTVNFTPLADDSAVQLNIIHVVIALAKGGLIDSEDPGSEYVIPSFTWRLYLYEDQDDNPLTPLTDSDIVDEFRPDADGFAYSDSSSDYLWIEGSQTYTFKFRLIYLDDESYQAYLAHNVEDATPYVDVTPFRFSGYEYMRATFTVTFEIGADVLVIDPGEGGGE